MWPEFSAADLTEAIRDFLKRERRFGKLPEAAAS
jgi:undecaprenyl pyrophosphate synthase